MAFPGPTVVKNPPANAKDTGSSLGSGRSTGGGNGNLLHYSCLENSMDRGAWWAAIHGGHKNVGHDWACVHCMVSFFSSSNLELMHLITLVWCGGDLAKVTHYPRSMDQADWHRSPDYLCAVLLFPIKYCMLNWKQKLELLPWLSYISKEGKIFHFTPNCDISHIRKKAFGYVAILHACANHLTSLGLKKKKKKKKNHQGF